MKITPPISYTEDDYTTYCDKLAAQDERFAKVIADHGYPDFWHRDPGFECLIRIILGQQVSLVSAQATYDKLLDRLGEITPVGVLGLSDSELKACGFSRQKTVYARELAEAVQSGALDVDGLARLPDADVRAQLVAIKGIGEWTVNVYLMLSLHRLDVFPAGDLALVKAMKTLGFLPEKHTKEAVVSAAAAFSPYQSIFAMLLWHAYLSETGGTMLC